MFRAIHKETRGEIISLDDCWRTRLDELRVLDRGNQLVCPECNGTVRIRAGEQNRWHFSHKDAGDCPLSESDPERVQLRALIYGWLAGKQPKLTLGIEERLQVDGKAYFVDCVISLEGGVRVAYFALAAGIRNRVSLIKEARKQYRYCHWIFHSRTLKPLRKTEISLSTTQRDLMYPLAQGAATALADGALHFLNPQTQALTTFRLLSCTHPPQGFRGVKHESPLGTMLVGPRTGELVHPDEVDRYLAKRKGDQVPRGKLFSGMPGQTAPAHQDRQSRRPIFCERCGCLKIDWSRLTSPGYCVCRDCV
jgi:hypothetical protein